MKYANSQVEKEEGNIEFEKTLTFSDRTIISNILFLVEEYINTEGWSKIIEVNHENS